jgi:uncharacterized membrane protein HdeD (DUF308 family)
MTANLFESHRTIADALKANWRAYVFEGVVTIVLGVLAIAYPVFATLAVDLYLGWLFLISGVLALVAMFSVRHVPGCFWWALVTALLAIVVGLALLLKPAAGIVSLTAVLTAFFIVEGAFQAATALSYREAIPHSWGWLLASGVADLVLAAIIISGWPGTVDWTLGLLAGVSLVTSGWAVVMVALSARNLVHSVKDAVGGR